MTPGPLRALAAVALCAAVVVSSRTAHAVEATSSEVRELAERALFEGDALERLRSIDSVDGRPADLGAALQGADELALSARLRSLAQAAPSQAVDGEAARTQAREILSDRRFQPAEPPRPFRGVLDRVGDRLDRTLTQPVGRALRALVRWIPGGETTLLVLLGVAVVALVCLIALRIARRRVRVSEGEPHGAARRLARDDPKDLERRAEQAERDGDFATAIRLRFVAGLLRLDGAGAIRYGPSLTAGQVRRTLRSQEFNRVAGSFEAVAYGGRSPTPDDVDVSRAGWRVVLHEVAA